jgi:DNA helicase-2/ATP-dependent DNA helicase PcrA
MPADMAAGSAEQIEEERRLLYVAMTRAKRHLALLVPQRFHVTQQPRLAGRHLYGSISRFVPTPVQGLFDWLQPNGRDCSAAAQGAIHATAPVDLMARMRDLF